MLAFFPIIAWTTIDFLSIMASDLTTGSDASRGIIAELLDKGSQISQDISSMFLSTRMQGIVEPSSLLDDKKYLVSRQLTEPHANRGI